LAFRCFVVNINSSVSDQIIMLLYSVASLTNASSIQHQPNWLHSGSKLRLSFRRNWKCSSSIIPSLICMHYPLCQFSGFLTRQCSSSRIHFHFYHSPSHHLLLVSENKPPSVIAVFVIFHRHTKSPLILIHLSFSVG